MTTEEMMEFYKNAWDKERENSNRLCMLKDEAIEKMIRLQEQIKEANELIKDYVHDANDCFTMGRINRYKEKWGVK